jgi:hypothetical protein
MSCNSTDPLKNIHFDVQDLVFQHLSGEEVKEISKVSSTWYEVLGNSKMCMKKLVLVMKMSSKKARSSLRGISSKRKYIHMKYDSGNDMKNNDLPRNLIEYSSMRSELLKFLDLQSKSLQHIAISTTDPLIVQNVLSMPKIKCVELNVENLETMKSLRQNKSIEMAKIEGKLDEIQNLLRCMPNLKALLIPKIHAGIINIVEKTSLKLDKLFFNIYLGEEKAVLNIHETDQDADYINKDINFICVNDKFQLRV